MPSLLTGVGHDVDLAVLIAGTASPIASARQRGKEGAEQDALPPVDNDRDVPRGLGDLAVRVVA